MNTYCKLANGDLVSKERVDNAIQLIARLTDGFTVVELSDEELFQKGNKFDAIKRFHEKHKVGLVEAKAAIEHLRGEELKGE
jgi:ribosomal protein L7/L12